MSVPPVGGSSQQGEPAKPLPPILKEMLQFFYGKEAHSHEQFEANVKKLESELKDFVNSLPPGKEKEQLEQALSKLPSSLDGIKNEAQLQKALAGAFAAISAPYLSPQDQSKIEHLMHEFPPTQSGSETQSKLLEWSMHFEATVLTMLPQSMTGLSKSDIAQINSLLASAPTPTRSPTSSTEINLWATKVQYEIHQMLSKK